jgi:two-component system, OmpR family, sensor kinase
MIFHSIRWRLQAWHGLILILVLAGFGVTAYQVARDSQFRRVDQDLDQRIMALLRPQPPEHPPEGSPGQPPDEMREEHPDGPSDPAEDQPSGPRRGERGRGGPFGSRFFLEKVRSAVQQGGALDPSETNTFYYVLWEQDGSVLARSPGAPTNVLAPETLNPSGSPGSQAQEATRQGPPPDPDPGMMPQARTRGQLREVFRFLPRGQCALVGRSLAPDLAALHRLALWLAAAGTAVLLLGLAGGWWVATGAIRPIEDISRTAVKIAGGDLSHRINAADTDSELGRLAAVLNSTFARLEAAFAQQARFTSDASHELRTPVSVILSQTQTALSRGRSSPEYREALEACERAARRMKALTESLLELARLDAGQEPLKREPFELARVVRECVELVQPLAGRRGVKFALDLPAVQCVGDAQRISQVVTNLLTNAIEFSPEQGKIHIAVDELNSTTTLRVADTGQGIPPEDLPHIFERFYRADKSRTRPQGRNGLGLAICKAIVDAHGGSIEVVSKPGAGSTFTVKLPRE